MDLVHQMSVFITVGEEASFAGAARKLDLSPAAITRAISSLEHQLGVALLLRTTRNVRLTEAGKGYLDDCRRILASITEANQAVAAVNAAPKGNLLVTASSVFGRNFIMPCIIKFLAECPDVEVSVHFLDRAVNMVKEGIDVAVHIGQMPDSGLRALSAGHVRQILCASPRYLMQQGVPQYPEDLPGHAIIAASAASTFEEWKFRSLDGPVVMRLKPRLMVTSNEAAIDAAVGGLGVCRLPSCQVLNELREGRLRIILAEYEEAPQPVYLLHRQSKFGVIKVRKFIDILAEQMRLHAHLSAVQFTSARNSELICA